MLELATILVYPFCTLVGLCSLFLALIKYRKGKENSSNLELCYQNGSDFVEGIVKRCKTLQEGYHPVFLWGWSGHIQTILFGVIGRASVKPISGQRYFVMAEDGSNVSYDVFEPDISAEERASREKENETASPLTFFVVPGINNSSEKDYMRVFARYCTGHGYRVIIFNHLGALNDEVLTGNRIFTYGGTGDVTLVYQDVCKRFPHDRLLGCGFSLGACILVRFLGECEKHQSRFIGAVGLCQGYNPVLHMSAMDRWNRLGAFYSMQISRVHRRFIMRHFSKLFSSDTSTARSATRAEGKYNPLPEKLWNGYRTAVVHDGHNSNGCCLDRSLCQAPDMDLFMNSRNMLDLDEAYTRRVLGFSSVEDLYRWISCEELMDHISDLPLLNLNAVDDPCIVAKAYDVPRKHARKHSKSLFVLSQHGGHLGFFEGALLRPRSETWIDRMVVEFGEACLAASL